MNGCDYQLKCSVWAADELLSHLQLKKMRISVTLAVGFAHSGCPFWQLRGDIMGTGEGQSLGVFCTPSLP